MTLIYKSFFALLFAFALTKCSVTRGGSQQGGSGSNTSPTPSNINPSNSAIPSTSSSISPGASTSITPGTSVNPSSSPGSQTATDQEVCAFIKAQAFASKVTAEIDYLCGSQGGLRSLLANPDGVTKTIVDKKEGTDGIFMFATAVQTKGTVKSAYDIGNLFCTDFAAYKREIGEAAFKDVESITPSNKVADGCDFEFKAKPIILFQAAYKGQVRGILNASGNIGAAANYLTQSISLVKQSVNLNILVKNGDSSLYIVSVLSNRSDVKGLHDQAKKGIMEGAAAGVKGFAAAVARK